MSALTRPAVWLLSHSTNLAVRPMGGDPRREQEDVSKEELRVLAGAHRAFTPDQRSIISGAFDVAERTLDEVLRPRATAPVTGAAPVLAALRHLQRTRQQMAVVVDE